MVVSEKPTSRVRTYKAVDEWHGQTKQFSSDQKMGATKIEKRIEESETGE